MTRRNLDAQMLVLILSYTLAVLVAAACGGSKPSPTALPAPTSAVPTVSSGSPFQLTETRTFGRFGYSMAYPSGWLIRVSQNTTLMSELGADHDRDWPSCCGGPRATKGYQASLTLESFPPNVREWTMEGLQNRYGLAHNLQVAGVPTEAQVFGVPARRVTGTLGFGRVVNCLFGLTEKLGFLLCLEAPSEQALSEFMPTWEQMLASIRPVGG